MTANVPVVQRRAKTVKFASTDQHAGHGLFGSGIETAERADLWLADRH
ncbi:MAG: hypothetical protein GY708_15850 [Actinomycetia bacterium]|nr:hypothetical protein [Actinomycetes bacterium]MCP4960737.1 hypothetical protein [Actinomycetes bacterium]